MNGVRDQMKESGAAAKLSSFQEDYKPITLAQFNGHDVMVVKVKRPFTWHKHDDTDDFFLILKGGVTIQMREGSVVLVVAFRRANVTG